MKHLNTVDATVRMDEIDILKRVNWLKDDINANFITMGALLFEIKNDKKYKAKGYQHFKDYIERELKLNNSFCNKLIGVYDLYVDKMEVDEEELLEIGFDKLHVIKPVVSDCEISVAESWIEGAKKTPMPELKEEVKKIKELKKKPKDFKEIFKEQVYTRLCESLNMNRKSLEYNLALVYHLLMQNLDWTKTFREQIATAQRQFEKEIEQSELEVVGERE